LIWLKICGITRLEDAEAAVSAGAAAVGFVFWSRSPRCTTVSQARAIGEALPPHIERAGVFVDACREEIVRVFDAAALTWVQLAGDEDIELARSLGVPWVKTFRVGGPASPQEPAGIGPGRAAPFAMESHERRFLLDTFVEGVPGGTGRTFDWRLAAPFREWARASGARMILAGGLTPSNVANAARRACPFGVDVSGGVESAPGTKSEEKIREFARALREAVE